MEKEIQKFVDADIIERVTDGPTELVLRIVTPSKPKKNGQNQAVRGYARRYARRQ